MKWENQSSYSITLRNAQMYYTKIGIFNVKSGWYYPTGNVLDPIWEPKTKSLSCTIETTTDNIQPLLYVNNEGTGFVFLPLSAADQYLHIELGIDPHLTNSQQLQLLYKHVCQIFDYNDSAYN